MNNLEQEKNRIQFEINKLQQDMATTQQLLQNMATEIIKRQGVLEYLQKQEKDNKSEK